MLKITPVFLIILLFERVAALKHIEWGEETCILIDIDAFNNLEWIDRHGKVTVAANFSFDDVDITQGSCNLPNPFVGGIWSDGKSFELVFYNNSGRANVEMNIYFNPTQVFGHNLTDKVRNIVNFDAGPIGKAYRCDTPTSHVTTVHVGKEAYRYSFGITSINIQGYNISGGKFGEEVECPGDTKSSRHSSPSTPQSKPSSPSTKTTNSTHPSSHKSTKSTLPSSTPTTHSSTPKRPTSHSSPSTKPTNHSTQTTKPTNHTSPTTKPTNHSSSSTKPTNHTTPTTKPTNHTTPSTKPTNHSSPSTKPTNHTSLTTKPTDHTTPSTKPTNHSSLSTKATNHTTPTTKPTNHTTPSTKPTNHSSPTTKSTNHSTPSTKPSSHSTPSSTHSSKSSSHPSNHSSRSTNPSTHPSPPSSPPLPQNFSQPESQIFNTQCMRMVGMFQLNLSYPSDTPGQNSSVVVGVNDINHVSGSCGDATINVLYVRFYNNWQLNITVKQENSIMGNLVSGATDVFWWSHIYIQCFYNTTSVDKTPWFPHVDPKSAKAPVVISKALKKKPLQAKLDGSYICKAKSTLDLGYGNSLSMWNLQYNAFQASPETAFSDKDITECSADSTTKGNTYIYVGIGLGVIVTMVMIVYIAGRCCYRKDFEEM